MEAGTRPSRAAQRRRGASAGAKTDPPVARRVRVRVDGTVQGVGFRPFVYRLARELSLGGFICNDEHGVLIDAEGPAAAVDALLERVAAEAPPLARVEGLRVDDAEPTGATPFTIAPSRGGGHAEVLVSPDVATCDQCLAEVLDPADRRHRYPFTNCTNCGPRFTIVRDVPYDRPLTTMAGFPLCDECRAEYTDPLDRRFHAQPVACARCGPQLRLIEAPGRDVGAEWSAVLPVAHPRDAISATAAAITAGRIVAVKGLGGYHLACRADNEHAVATLRARKHREDKPFALMVGDLEGARRLVELAGPERELLVAPERPIVIARRRAGVDGAVAPSVAPHGPDLGLMLPYTPLHHLLLADVARLTGVPGVFLVMTSGNVSDEPIAFDDADARKRLASIADLFCVHDRPIYVRADDSVVRATDPELATGPLVIRRSRGWAPRSTDLPWSLGRPVLGVGAELKSTFCVAKGTRAWVGPHVGDLKNWETLESFREGIAHLQRLFAVEPEVVAHDLHPDYLSTGYAMEREGVERVAVQHHHAHLAACLAEHGETGEAVGAIFDGAGYGTDGTVWGGELLVGGLAGFERRGRLLPVRLPGGDAATREPWRMACAWLAAAEGEARPSLPAVLAGEVGQNEWESVSELVGGGVLSPETSSAGRLFDAVAALCGLRARVNHEGQAAAELEGIADLTERGAYPLPLIWRNGLVTFDARETVAAVSAEIETGVPRRLAAARFHNALAAATAQGCAIEAERAGLDVVVLSGGVFQNRLLLERTVQRLRATGLRVLVPRKLPPNDGGISYGQVAVAGARDRTARR